MGFAVRMLLSDYYKLNSKGQKNKSEFKSINQTLNFQTFLTNSIHLTELLNVYNSNKPL